MRSAYALVTEHRPFVRASLRQLGVSGTALDDAEQEVFLVVVRRRADFDPERGSERGWIWGICRNVASAHRRARRRRSNVEAIGDVGSRPPIEEQVDVAQALSALDHDSRLLWLARCEGRTARELAETLDLPLTTVQWRLRQAKRSMQTMLRGITRSGHAIVTWLLRPQHGFGPLLAPALAILVLASASTEDPAPPRDEGQPAVVTQSHGTRTQAGPREATAVVHTPPSATAGVVLEGEPTLRRRRRKSRGRVSLGDPSFE